MTEQGEYERALADAAGDLVLIGPRLATFLGEFQLERWATAHVSYWLKVRFLPLGEEAQAEGWISQRQIDQWIRRSLQIPVELKPELPA